MKTWNMGNTTARNPYRLRDALRVFVDAMSGRPFKKPEQQEFLNIMVRANLVESERITGGDDGGRKFASAFKQLGFVTDWSKGQSWSVTAVGRTLLDRPELEENLFLRQLLKYQIPSPLERVSNFHVRPFRLLLRFLRRSTEENLDGLTKHEIGIFVISILNEDDDKAFEDAISKIKSFRSRYNALKGKVAKTKFVQAQLKEAGTRVGLIPQSLLDYADSNGRYALMSGLLTLRGNRLSLLDTRLPIVDAILSDGTKIITNENEYLKLFYNPNEPKLPTDDIVFLTQEIANLERSLREIAISIEEPLDIPEQPKNGDISEQQAYEKRLRLKIREKKELLFYREQSSLAALEDIEGLLDDIIDRSGAFFGGGLYAPAFFEWAIWRLFLSMNEFIGPISKTRGFEIDEDMNPIHHAKGGAADLTFTYNDFKIVCEMTLANGSRQFAMEGEPVTRHVFKEIEISAGKPVYGLFIAKQLDPNTVDAFHNARFWSSWNRSVNTPIVALEIKHVIELIKQMKVVSVSSKDIRKILDNILELQKEHINGPSWYHEYSIAYSNQVSKIPNGFGSDKASTS